MIDGGGWKALLPCNLFDFGDCFCVLDFGNQINKNTLSPSLQGFGQEAISHLLYILALGAIFLLDSCLAENQKEAYEDLLQIFTCASTL